MFGVRVMGRFKVRIRIMVSICGVQRRPISDSKVFSEVCIEGFLRCIDRLLEAFREDLHRSIDCRNGF